MTNGVNSSEHSQTLDNGHKSPNSYLKLVQKTGRGLNLRIGLRAWEKR